MNPLAAKLAECLLTGATGALDWTDGKRRRLIFVEGGAITLVQSNLKSESIDRAREQNPGLDDAQLLAAAGRARMAGIFKETTGEAKWVEGQAAPRREPVDFADGLFTTGLPRPPVTSYPRSQAPGCNWLARQPMSPELSSYLLDLDGTRTLDEVLEFAPGGPAAAERWIRIGFALGALADAGIETSVYEVRTVTKKRAWSGGVDDIAAMIADATGDTTPRHLATATQPVAARLGPVHARIMGAADHFGVLGVSWQDPPETIRRSYFTLARELHPDRFVEDSAEVQSSAAEIFDHARAAWEVLGDEKKREAYIARVIRGEKTEEEQAMDKVRAILDSESEFKRGLADYYAGRLAQAHDIFTRCAERVPEELEFAAYAGYTTFKIHHGKDEAKAEAGAKRLFDAVQGSERLDSGWVLIGLVHRAKSNDKAARDAFVTALKIKPANPDAMRELKRMEKEKEAKQEDDASFISRLFGKKK
ncbi:MAG: DnaJ domain-containing protein [Deltaproteobacteria bacterium]|nr:DnaJ domain-containing protein [Deltaproteobacteria bacterium]